MVDTGSINIMRARPYEDLSSLKKHIRASPARWDITEFREVMANVMMASSGAGDEVEADDGITISYIGRTEVTLELSAGANEASHNGKVFSLTWEDQDGNEYTSEATGTATLNDTPVAFATPVTTSVYKVTAFTVSAAFANQDVIALVNAGKTYATITAAATAATEAQLMGVGDLYGRAHTDHSDADLAVLQLEYLSGSGEIKYGHCTFGENGEATTPADEVRFFEGTYDATTDTVTATSTTVKDFYRVRRLWSTTTPTANSHEFYIGDDNAANDGSGNDLYGLILEGSYEMVNTRYTTPAGYDAVIAQVEQWASYVEDDFYILKIAYKIRNAAITRTDIYDFHQYIKINPLVYLEPMNDVIFYSGDTDAAANITTKTYIIECKRS